MLKDYYPCQYRKSEGEWVWGHLVIKRNERTFVSRDMVLVLNHVENIIDGGKKIFYLNDVNGNKSCFKSGIKKKIIDVIQNEIERLTQKSLEMNISIEECRKIEKNEREEIKRREREIIKNELERREREELEREEHEREEIKRREREEIERLTKKSLEMNISIEECRKIEKNEREEIKRREREIIKNELDRREREEIKRREREEIKRREREEHEREELRRHEIKQSTPLLYEEMKQSLAIIAQVFNILGFLQILSGLLGIIADVIGLIVIGLIFSPLTLLIGFIGICIGIFITDCAQILKNKL